MLSNEIKRLKMKKIKFENFEKKILKLDTYRRITHLPVILVFRRQAHMRILVTYTAYEEVP